MSRKPGPQQLACLVLLSGADLTAPELANSLHVSTAAALLALYRLERAGRVSREIAPADRAPAVYLWTRADVARQLAEAEGDR